MQVYGKLKESKNGSSYFEWSHSYSRVFPKFKEERYSFKGPFMQFASFDVETRPRVKCVTAMEGTIVKVILKP